jgi:hypothetical protein
MKQFLKEQYTNCMTIPEYNSRVVYLVSALTSLLGSVAVVIAFIFAKDKTGYDTILLAITGGGLASGVSKWMQKTAQGKIGTLTNALPVVAEQVPTPTVPTRP